MDFQTFVDKAFWILLLGVFSFGIATVKESLKDLNISVGSLNEKMAVVVQTVAMHDRQIGGLPQINIQLTEMRVRLEKVEKKCEKSSGYLR